MPQGASHAATVWYAPSILLLDNRTLFRHFSMKGLRKTLVEIGHNVRIKTYPDGSSVILVASVPIFRDSGWELSCEPKAAEKVSDKSDSLSRARRRARSAVYDIARATEFKYFVTLTLDKEQVNRYDPTEIIKKLNTWLDNNVRRRGLTYILIPEHHKDGAIHFHGFFNAALPVADSGHADRNGHTIYNLPRWSYGFSTAIELYGDYSSAVGYVCKYINKQEEKIGGRWYYSGGDIRRPVITLSDMDFSEAMSHEGGYAFDIPQIGASFIQIGIDNRGENVPGSADFGGQDEG